MSKKIVLPSIVSIAIVSLFQLVVWCFFNLENMVQVAQYSLFTLGPVAALITLFIGLSKHFDTKFDRELEGTSRVIFIKLLQANWIVGRNPSDTQIKGAIRAAFLDCLDIGIIEEDILFAVANYEEKLKAFFPYINPSDYVSILERIDRER